MIKFNVYIGNNLVSYDLSNDNTIIGDKTLHGSINSYTVLEADIKYKGNSFANIEASHLNDFVRMAKEIPDVSTSHKENKIRTLVSAPNVRSRGNGFEGLTGPILTSLEEAKAEFLKLTSAIRSGNSSSDGKERAIYLADLLREKGILT